ncbi:MAG TPA: choice-of-anchor tandem repeat GloVer-containing protein, partial [Candidatus Limnocylindrales bacterium]|nr:choice-of-anchor tandem repeat GloVer-containing protein [Candidatus Limnocylindrales bacterium]
MFAINTNGTGFTTLHSFTAVSGSGANSDGTGPLAGLILSGNTLYGTAVNGGSSGHGTVFALNTNGTGFLNLHSFTATSGYPSINSDGVGPLAGLILSGNTLYGTAYYGGGSGYGTVFSLSLGPASAP